jgi:chaperonin GroEL
VILDDVRRLHDGNGNERIGYDVLREDFVDMVEAGIIDPAKVSMGVLCDAASIAAIILSTEALMVDMPQGEPPAPPGPPEHQGPG